MIYRLLKFFFRIATGVFYRRVEVEGRENLPETGPVLIVPNHPNGLIDAVMIALQTARPVSLTGKSTLAQIPVVRFLMSAIHLIPMHRRQDQALGSDPSRNSDSLAECRRRLAEGGALCIFPEGISHSRPCIMPLKTGAARIALDYLAIDGNPGGLKIVPVGLHFDDKGRFRSHAVLRFGEAIEAAAWRAENPEGGPRDLTFEIERRLRRAAFHFDRKSEALLLGWAAETLATAAEPPAPVGAPLASFARRLEIVDRLQAGYEALQPWLASDLARVSSRVRRYRSELRDLAIDPAEVYLPMSPGRAARFCLREAAEIAVALPLAAWGAINNAAPYLIAKRIAVRHSDGPEVTSSYALIPSLVLFPAFYAAQTVAAGLAMGAMFGAPVGCAAAAIYAALLPASGLSAVRLSDRLRAAGGRGRTYLRFRFNRGLRTRLEAEGRAIIDEIRALEEPAAAVAA